MKSFLEDFKTVDRDQLGLTTRLPMSFIKKYLDERGPHWDIALYKGTGQEQFTHKNISVHTQQRQIRKNNGAYVLLKSQVSSGNAEAVAFLDDKIKNELGNDRRKARKLMQNPLLMLHILQQSDPAQDNIPQIAAFGISFPGDALSMEKPVTMKINTVYFQQLLEKLKLEGESDD